jgi:hypothetical protein
VAREELDSPKWQCTMSLRTPHSRVSRQPHVIASTPAVIARFSSCRLLPFPEDEDAAERLLFSHRCRDPVRIAKGYGLAYTKCLWGHIPTVAGMLWVVHCCIWWLFQRRYSSNLGK